MVKQQTKYIFVTGGVLSGLGKGITAASIGNILKARGLSVNIQKLDPYLNVDAGTLNPAEHGECFVTADGAETDLDLGHYERFLDVELTHESSVMSGRILRDLIQAERDGKFLGKTVQVVPHFTDSIQDHILAAAKGNDVHIVEIGGTVGDYESPPFYEAIREMAIRVGRENCLYVQVLYLPYLGTSKETKTKPAQNAVRDLRAVGVVPDVLVARSEHVPTTDVAAKLSAFASVPEEAIVLLPNAKTVYEVPLTLEKAGIGDFITRRLAIKAKKPNMKAWQSLVERALDTSISEVRVGVVAKYLDNEDTYMSVFEALNAAGYALGSRVKIEWIDAEGLSKKNVAAQLGELDGILVPGGFGTRGVEGKIIAAGYAMEQKIPYLGLCLGMQVAVVAMARKLGYDANSLEVDPQTKCPVIYIMNGQEAVKETGGTMRLGDYECVLAKGSLSAKLYGQKTIMERHRHRYEFNNQYREELEAAGMIMAGVSPDKSLVELIELKDHPFYIASQFHPEFKSRPNKPHPLFSGFIAAIQS